MRSCTASPGRDTNTGRAAYVPVIMQRQVPPVFRVRHPCDSVHRQNVGHSCYATETGIRSATVQVAGSVHSRFLSDEVAAALVVEIGSCIFRAGFAGDHAILAVLPWIGDRPKIFDNLVGTDQKVCVSLRTSFVFQRNAWFDSGYYLCSSTDFFVFQCNACFDSGYICRVPRRGSGLVFAGLLVTMISRAGPWSLDRCIRCDSSSCLLASWMWGRFFGALCLCTGPGIMSTGT